LTDDVVVGTEQIGIEALAELEMAEAAVEIGESFKKHHLLLRK
jgi:hypothetical protein